MTNETAEITDSCRVKDIHRKVFTNWVSHLMSTTDLPLTNLEELGDDVHLSHLVEIVSGKEIGKRMHRRRMLPHVQTDACIEYVIHFLKEDGLELDIGARSIMDGDMTIIIHDLLWPVLIYYLLPRRTTSTSEAGQQILDWTTPRLQGMPVRNLVDDWKDGRALGALVNSLKQDLCSDWSAWVTDDPVANLTSAIQAAASIGVHPLISADDIMKPDMDEMSMIVYLHQFIRASDQINNQQNLHSPQR